MDVGALAAGSDVTITFDVTINDPFPAGVSTIDVHGWVTSNELAPVPSDDPSSDAELDATSIGVTNDGGVGGGPAPDIGAVSPADGIIATEPISVTTTLAPPPGETIAGWEITYRPADADMTVPFASGAGTDVSATFDPTVLPNGTYILIVEAEASGGGISMRETSVIVDGQLKLGRYVPTFQDMNVGIGGIPLQVLRTYDSFDKRTGDPSTGSGQRFGVGWTVDIANFRVGANKPLGLGGW